MRDRARRGWAILLIGLAALHLLGTSPVLGAVPQPVIPVEGPVPDDERDRDDEVPVAACPAGSFQAGTTPIALAANTPGSPVHGSYPQPVIPLEPGGDPSVEEPSRDCIAHIFLSLILKAPQGRKPEGADADLDGSIVPRNILESGFDASLPAQSRSIGLGHPGEDWEIMSTSCTCGGGPTSAGGGAVTLTSSQPGPGLLATYPGPVVPVGPGGGSCLGPSGGSAPTAGSGLLVAADPDGTHLTTYPGPVIPVEPPSDQAATLAPAIVSWTPDGSVFIDDPDGTGGLFSCTWTVELVKGRFTVTTMTDPPGEEGAFSYLVTPTGPQVVKASPTTMRGTASGEEASLYKGPWSMELTNIGQAWEVRASTCSETDGTTVSTASGSTATLGLDPGDRVRCTFTLDLVSPRPGPWRALNRRGRVRCGGGVNLRLDPLRENGRIQVLDDGDHLIGRGLTGDSKAIDLYRDSDDPLRYQGTETISFQGGRAEFDFDFRMRNDRHLVGSMEAKARLAGRDCKISRRVDLTYRGGD